MHRLRVVQLMGVIGRVLHDPFHEVRKEGTLVMRLLAVSHPVDTQLHSAVLVIAAATRSP